ncbi:putative uncharacterized protein DDB_G0283051 [Protopterus annectens]|uniref:putative uncharacterized protein DDB_G0283051 n=1 Tax=Protopterus annectens TaxID=7888 RepID=UPI001CFC1D7B|nr:putative uncharacterized protein DDB_G0283051 [Protopterus annectens]
MNDLDKKIKNFSCFSCFDNLYCSIAAKADRQRATIVARKQRKFKRDINAYANNTAYSVKNNRARNAHNNNINTKTDFKVNKPVTSNVNVNSGNNNNSSVISTDNNGDKSVGGSEANLQNNNNDGAISCNNEGANNSNTNAPFLVDKQGNKREPTWSKVVQYKGKGRTKGKKKW